MLSFYWLQVLLAAVGTLGHGFAARAGVLNDQSVGLPVSLFVFRLFIEGSSMNEVMFVSESVGLV